MAGDSLPLYNDGTYVREWIYAEDMCRALRTILKEGTPGAIYNVGIGEERGNVKMARTILDIGSSSEELIEFVPDRL